MLVVLWEDAHSQGPHMQLLAAAADMGAARRFAQEADMRPPEKGDRVSRGDPLYAVAMSQPGELLWRADANPDHLDGFEAKPWRSGVEAARRFRDDDVRRYTGVVQAARERRKHRK